jgi:hypothetical protein
MKSHSETRKDSWLWKAKALRVDVLARPEKLKNFAQISTKRRRKTFLFTRKFTRVATKLLNPENFRIYPSPTNFNDGQNWVWDIPAQNKSRDATLKLKKFDSLQVLRSCLAPNWKRDQFQPFFSPPNGKWEQENRGIDSQRRVRATIYAESYWAVDVKGPAHQKRFKKSWERWLVSEVLPCMKHEEVRRLRQHMQTRNVYA